jgi:putative transposase
MKRRRHTLSRSCASCGKRTGCWPRAARFPRSPRRWRSSEASYHRWRAQYGGLKAADVRRLKELETENAQLKRIVADKELQIEALKELGRGNW